MISFKKELYQPSLFENCFKHKFALTIIPSSYEFISNRRKPFSVLKTQLEKNLGNWEVNNIHFFFDAFIHEYYLHPLGRFLKF